MLFDPARFDALTETAWDERRVADGIRAIVADADADHDPDGLWPADEWDAWQAPTPLLSLYVGAAGVIWALDVLRRRGLAESRLDLASTAGRAVEIWRRQPDFMAGIELPEPARSAFMSGLAGILAVAHRVAPSQERLDELFTLVSENVSNTATGLMWGSPGTMLVARRAYDETGDERWREVWRESATRLLDERGPDGLWEQRLYGESFRGLGTTYGLVGNVLALLDGGEWLADDELTRRTGEVLRASAVHEDGLVNWPSAVGEPLEGADGVPRLQWCTGAAGIAVSAAPYLDEDLLLAAAETVWRAGPHGREKGSSICHGTAGNGYALLAAFDRTGDEMWLDRARRFAVHALEQVSAARIERGQGRYSLWTGDVGVAVYGCDCLLARTAYPVLANWG